MNGKIEDSTLERLSEIRGKPVRRGLDTAINECLTKLEGQIDDSQSSPTIEVCDFTKKMANDEEETENKEK